MRSLALPRPRTQPPQTARSAGPGPGTQEPRNRDDNGNAAATARDGHGGASDGPSHDQRRRRARHEAAQVGGAAKSGAGTATAARQAAPRRHAGPYGASFDGTDPNGKPAKGLTFERRWTRPGVHPYDEITWEYRTAGIANESGKSVFEQKDVEVPNFWSQLATNVVVSKYFRGHLNTPERETSVKQLIDRVVNTIASWAETQRYFASDEDLATFKAELTHLIVHQKMAFNSPGLVQRRDREAAAVLRVLHQLGPGHDEQHHGPRQDRGDALQVRLGRGQQPLHDPLLQGEDGRRRHGERARSPS